MTRVDSRTLTLNSGTGGTIAVSGALDLAGLDITNSNGATFTDITFSGGQLRSDGLTSDDTRMSLFLEM